MKEFKVKETKSVELDRLKIVKDVHIDGWLNPRTTKKKKDEIVEYMKTNGGVYPREEAILVWKARDPKDRRKVVYNIEDGYRRSILARELGLDKVYVNIIDEENN